MSLEQTHFSKKALTRSNTDAQGIKIVSLGTQAYLVTQERMQQRVGLDNIQRDSEIWLLQHPPVYTQGTSCQQVTLLPSGIPVVKSDRGGQITYHGPGQIVMYPLLNLRDLGLGVKNLVYCLEQAVIDVLARYGVTASRRENAPGVYVQDAKIAALGLRVKQGFSYHGLSFNYAMDLTPFANIDPCGFKGLQVTQFKDLVSADLFASTCHDEFAYELAEQFKALL